MADLKRSIVEVKTETILCGPRPYCSHREINDRSRLQGIPPGAENIPQSQLLERTAISLDNGRGIPEFESFQDHFRQYKIFVYTQLNCDEIMFEGHVETSERLNLLYDEVTRHYHMIGDLTAAMAKGYVCKACSKGGRRDVTHTCDQTCSSCIASPPCVSTRVRIPCADCDRHFRSQICFANHKRRIGNKKPVCERKRQAVKCGELVVSGKNTNAANTSVTCATRTQI